MGAAEPAIGTNPICWCIPGKEFPIVLDMAISPARGKIKNAAAAGKPIPEGWALDKNGRPTTDAAAALEGMLAAHCRSQGLRYRRGGSVLRPADREASTVKM